MSAKERGFTTTTEREASRLHPREASRLQPREISIQNPKAEEISARSKDRRTQFYIEEDQSFMHVFVASSGRRSAQKNHIILYCQIDEPIKGGMSYKMRGFSERKERIPPML